MDVKVQRFGGSVWHRASRRVASVPERVPFAGRGTGHASVRQIGGLWVSACKRVSPVDPPNFNVPRSEQRLGGMTSGCTHEGTRVPVQTQELGVPARVLKKQLKG